MTTAVGVIWGRLWGVRIGFATRMATMWIGPCGRGCTVYPTARIYGGRRVRFGDRVTINDYVHIWGVGGVSIGDDTMIAAHSVIVSQTHELDALRQGRKYRETLTFAPVKIGNNVWIGSSVTILPGVTIGDGAVIGAGAVVTRDIPPAALAIGVPARVIRLLGEQNAFEHAGIAASAKTSAQDA